MLIKCFVHRHFIIRYYTSTDIPTLYPQLSLKVIVKMYDTVKLIFALILSIIFISTFL